LPAPRSPPTEIVDHTTGQKSFVTASVANGFRHILFDPVPEHL